MNESLSIIHNSEFNTDLVKIKTKVNKVAKKKRKKNTRKQSKTNQQRQNILIQKQKNTYI